MKKFTSPDFRSRILHASLWASGGFMAQKIFQLISNMILTRILFPEAFGLMTLANTILIGLQMFSDVGIKPAIIQNTRGDDPSFLNTAWTIQVYRGFILWAASVALSIPASIIYKNDILIPLISVLGATAAVSGFSSISLALAERRLEGKLLTISMLVGQFITLLITAISAWMLQSVWALALGSLAGTIVSTTLSHVLLPHHQHQIRWEPDAVKSLIHFGRWIFFTTAITFLGGQGIRALQGLFVPPATLGILAIAQTLAWVPGDLTSQLMNLVGFPALSEINLKNPERLADTLSKMRRKTLTAAITMFSALGILSFPIINIMYDERYIIAYHYLMILTITGSISTIPLGYQSAILATGSTRVHFQIMSVTMIARVTIMIAGFRLADIDGMLLGLGIGTLIGYCFTAHHAQRRRLFDWRTDLAAFCGIGVSSLTIWSLYS